MRVSFAERDRLYEVRGQDKVLYIVKNRFFTSYKTVRRVYKIRCLLIRKVTIRTSTTTWPRIRDTDLVQLSS